MATSRFLRSDVEEARISAELYGEHIDNPYCVIPEQLAIQKLFLHQAALDSVEVDEARVIRAADEQINRAIQNFGSRENVETVARKSIAQYREQQKTMYRNNLMIGQVRENITKNVKVTPAEVRKYFSSLPEDSLPLIPTQVEVQIITSVPKVSRAEVERIESRLRDFAKRINSGESEFSTLAKIYSQDGSARNGGELGYSGRNQWVPEFANVAFSLNDLKKVSKIVRTEFGFHIIQLIDKRGDRINVRHILLKPEIEESEYDRALGRLIPSPMTSETTSSLSTRPLRCFPMTKTRETTMASWPIPTWRRTRHFQIPDVAAASRRGQGGGASQGGRGVEGIQNDK